MRITAAAEKLSAKRRVAKERLAEERMASPDPCLKGETWGTRICGGFRRCRSLHFGRDDNSRFWDGGEGDVGIADAGALPCPGSREGAVALLDDGGVGVFAGSVFEGGEVVEVFAVAADGEVERGAALGLGRASRRVGDQLRPSSLSE
jgi:hypothetical protein